MISLDSLPANARLAGTRLLATLREILDEDLVALWLHGGTTFADRPRRTGDLDVAGILRAVRPEERTPRLWYPDRTSRPSRIVAAQEAIGAEAGLEIDAMYFLEDEMHRGARPPRAFRRSYRETGWAVHRAHWLAGQYVLLYGKPPDEIVQRPTAREIRSALDRELEHLERHVAEGDASDPYEATYAIWNGLRILRTIETGDPVVSKRSAGTWGLEHMAARWHPVIEAAGRAYDGEATEADRELLRTSMGPFVAMVRRRLPTATTRDHARPRWS